RHEPDDVIIGFGSSEFDPEGRYVEARYGKLSVVSVYVPSGSSGEERQQAKYRFMDEFMPHLAELKSKRAVSLCGDVN
ncbi:exodeoxyribonuclease III, partial [Paraburkholderia sp. SIMBA_050]